MFSPPMGPNYWEKMNCIKVIYSVTKCEMCCDIQDPNYESPLIVVSQVTSSCWLISLFREP